jgi:hypothetical protein
MATIRKPWTREELLDYRYSVPLNLEVRWYSK